MEGTLSLAQGVTKSGIHARAIHNALPTTIPFGHPAFPKKTNNHEPQVLTKHPSQNRPNGTSDSLGHAVSKELIFFARAHHIERAVSFARAVPWRVRDSVLRVRPREPTPRFFVFPRTCGSTPCSFGKTEWWWLFRYERDYRLLGNPQ